MTHETDDFAFVKPTPGSRWHYVTREEPATVIGFTQEPGKLWVIVQWNNYGDKTAVFQLHKFYNLFREAPAEKAPGALRCSRPACRRPLLPSETYCVFCGPSAPLVEA